MRYLVGTPKGRLTRIQKTFLDLPWQEVRQSVTIDLAPPAIVPLPDRIAPMSVGQGITGAAPTDVRPALAADPMTRPGALERIAAHQAGPFPRLVAWLRTKLVRILFGIAHDPGTLSAKPAIGNAPDAGADPQNRPRKHTPEIAVR